MDDWQLSSTPFVAAQLACPNIYIYIYIYVETLISKDNEYSSFQNKKIRGLDKK